MFDYRVNTNVLTSEVTSIQSKLEEIKKVVSRCEQVVSNVQVVHQKIETSAPSLQNAIGLMRQSLAVDTEEVQRMQNRLKQAKAEQQIVSTEVSELGEEKNLPIPSITIEK
jgi:chromosome segregation ATPase